MKKEEEKKVNHQLFKLKSKYLLKSKKERRISL
jgi:hypothetical protein